MSEPQSEWITAIRAGRCPDCGAQELFSGPRGGASLNLTCASCGARWNAGGAAYGLGTTFFVERIEADPAWREPTPVQKQMLTALEHTALVALLATVVIRDREASDRPLWLSVLEKIEGLDVVVLVERP